MLSLFYAFNIGLVQMSGRSQWMVTVASDPPEKFYDGDLATAVKKATEKVEQLREVAEDSGHMLLSPEPVYRPAMATPLEEIAPALGAFVLLFAGATAELANIVVVLTGRKEAEIHGETAGGVQKAALDELIKSGWLNRLGDEIDESLAIYNELMQARNRLLHDDWWYLGSHVGLRGFLRGGGDRPTHNQPSAAALFSMAKLANKCKLDFSSAAYRISRNISP